MRLLLISDTHIPGRARTLPDAVRRAADDADLVVHAGDWVAASVLDDLARHAEVLGVWGNNDGADLRGTVDVSLEDAILGGPIRVPTLTGAVEMKIPPMTGSGRTFRLRGKGLPKKDGSRGDLLATTAIVLPATDDPALTDYAQARRDARAGSGA